MRRPRACVSDFCRLVLVATNTPVPTRSGAERAWLGSYVTKTRYLPSHALSCQRLIDDARSEGEWGPTCPAPVAAKFIGYRAENWVARPTVGPVGPLGPDFL